MMKRKTQIILLSLSLFLLWGCKSARPRLDIHANCCPDNDQIERRPDVRFDADYYEIKEVQIKPDSTSAMIHGNVFMDKRPGSIPAPQPYLVSLQDCRIVKGTGAEYFLLVRIVSR